LENSAVVLYYSSIIEEEWCNSDT